MADSPWKAWLSLTVDSSTPGQTVTYDLAVVSLQELGFDAEVLYEEVCARADEQGLDLFPQEFIVGLAQLCSQDVELERGKRYILAMPSARKPDGRLTLFHIVCEYDTGLKQDIQSVASHTYNSDAPWYPSDAFVFVIRKAAS